MPVYRTTWDGRSLVLLYCIGCCNQSTFKKPLGAWLLLAVDRGGVTYRLEQAHQAPATMNTCMPLSAACGLVARGATASTPAPVLSFFGALRAAAPAVHTAGCSAALQRLSMPEREPLAGCRRYIQESLQAEHGALFCCAQPPRAALVAVALPCRQGMAECAASERMPRPSRPCRRRRDGAPRARHAC